MKRIVYPILITLLTLGLYSCSEDDSLQERLPSDDYGLNISVFSAADESVLLADAIVEVYDGPVLMGSYSLREGIANFPMKENAGKNYTLKLSSDGYETGSIDISDQAHQKFPPHLKVKLNPVIQMVVETFADDDDYVLELEGSGVVTIVWPDKTAETLSMPLSVSRQFDVSEGNMILIKGDIQKITSFRAFGYNTAITRISGLQHLSVLQSFLPGLLRLTEKLDLRHNHNLQVIDLFEATLPHWFTLPQKHALHSITITLSNRAIMTKEIDMLINNIYHNATRRAIRGGMIALTNSEMPSAKAIREINILERQYGWNIELNL